MDLASHQELRVHIRWMIRRDMPEVLDIEGESFEFPWLEDDFIRCLRQRNCIGMVAEHDDRVVGFMIYELHKTRLHILNFAVGDSFRQQGVGRQMASKLISKLSQQRRYRIHAALHWHWQRHRHRRPDREKGIEHRHRTAHRHLMRQACRHPAGALRWHQPASLWRRHADGAARSERELPASMGMAGKRELGCVVVRGDHDIAWQVFVRIKQRMAHGPDSIVIDPSSTVGRIRAA